MKKFLSELTPIEIAAEILAFICLCIYIVMLIKGLGKQMLFMVGLILIFNGLGCMNRNPSNCKTGLVCGITVILINLFQIF